jgi:hypothetical protein
MGHRQRITAQVKAVAALAASMAGMLAGVVPAEAMQSRTFVISWFAQATYSNDHDCSGGVHPEIEQIYFRYAQLLGVNAATIEGWRKKLMEGEDTPDLQELVGMRGRVDGKPVNPYTNPASVVDLKLPGLDGQYAYGFNLDGKGAGDPNAFEDPQTHERGVEHQLYRALGCSRAFRGSLEGRPTYWAWAWGQLKESQPAWLITLSGADLGHDGPITISIDRALEHLRSNSDGTARPDMGYRIDPDPRSHNSFRGEIKGGMAAVTQHDQFRILQNPMVAPQLDLQDFHLRMTSGADGLSKGFLAGYQPWHDLYFAIAGIGIGGEQQVTGDIPGFYYLMKRYADADPDPQTGQNRRISATYYFEAVPAFVAPASGVPAQTVAGR